jgi:hydrogenase nickel incorporation protein HypA/HybF
MHELSIAIEIVEALTEELHNELGVVQSVQLRVGGLSGVEPDALRFAWDFACRDTRLDGSTLEIDEVPPAIWCEHCRCEQSLPNAFLMRCPNCATPAARITAGRELEILSVEMADHEPAEVD